MRYAWGRGEGDVSEGGRERAREAEEKKLAFVVVIAATATAF